MTTLSHMSTIVGTPTLKGEIRKARASGYTFVKAMGDICDGAITMPGGTEVHIEIIPCTDNPNEISSIIIRDNIPKGMHKLQYTGTEHPFCWTHETTDHADNEILSEFGTGLKAAAVNLGNQFDLVTKYKDHTLGKLIYKKIQCNWDTMVSKNTFDPDIFDISVNNYNNDHISPQKISLGSGTSMTFSNLVRNFVPELTTTISQLKSYISTTYYNSNRTITLNGDIIKPNIPFTLRENHPWPIYTMHLEVYDNSPDDYYIISDKDSDTKMKKIMEYDTSKQKWTAVKLVKAKYDDIRTNHDLTDTLIFRGTKQQGFGSSYHGGSINISRQNRMLAISKREGATDTSFASYISFGSKFHMENHYNFMHLEYNNKKIGKLLGISYTKSLDGNFPNNILTSSLNHIQRELLKLTRNNTHHNSDWLKKYGVEWVSKLSYDDNLKATLIRKRVIKREATILIHKCIRRYMETQVHTTTLPPVPPPAPAKTKPSLAPAPSPTPSPAPSPALPTVSHSNLSMSNHSNPYNQSELNMAQYGDQNYLGIFGASDFGYEIDINGTMKAKFGHTQQRGDRRQGGGDYPRRNFQMISIDTVSVNCEPQLYQELNKIPGVVFETKEQFSFPTDKLGVVKKTYNTVVQQHFRAPQ